MADPGFSRGGSTNSQNSYYFSNFCRKLHENERIWTPGGRVLGAPLRSVNALCPSINYGFQSQSGQPYSHLAEVYLKPRGDVTKSPKQGYQWPTKRIYVLQNLKRKKLLPILFADFIFILSILFMRLYTIGASCGESPLTS